MASTGYNVHLEPADRIVGKLKDEGDYCYVKIDTEQPESGEINGDTEVAYFIKTPSQARQLASLCEDLAIGLRRWAKTQVEIPND